MVVDPAEGANSSPSSEWSGKGEDDGLPLILWKQPAEGFVKLSCKVPAYVY